MSEQWQAPWQYGWEQQPPLPAPWEPPVTPLPPRRNRVRRRVLWAVAGLVTVALLLWLPGACAPDQEHPAPPVVDTPSPSPESEPIPLLPPPPPSPWSSPSPSPAAPSSSPSPSASASPSASVPSPARPTPRQSRSPKPAKPSKATRPTSPSTSTSPPEPGAGAGPLASLKVCAEAERAGQWSPGSEQAKVCRSLYGG